MTISAFLPGHQGQDLASPNEIIPISFQSSELLNNADILCPAKKTPMLVRRVTRRMAQPGEVAPVWPLTGETRRPEHVPHPQPIQRQRQPHKHVVHAEVYAPMEPPEPEVPTKTHMADEAWEQVRHPPTPKDPVEEATGVPEPLQLPIVPPQPKPMVLEQTLPQVLPMPRQMPLSDMLPKVPEQPIPFQGLINPRPLDIRLLGTLPGYDNDIDEKQPEVTIRQPDKTMYRKSKKLMKSKVR